MKSFKDFEINSNSEDFDGDSIGINKILNCEIIVHKYKIGPSKYGGECLTLQIEHKNDKRIVWTGSAKMMKDIQQVPKDGFPFKTTIVRTDKKTFEFN